LVHVSKHSLSKAQTDMSIKCWPNRYHQSCEVSNRT